MLFHLTSIGLGLIFLCAAVGKLRDLRGFADAVQAFDMLPSALANTFGYVLPFVELATALLLLVGWLPLVAGGLAVLMLTSFAIALGMNAWRGRALNCHCFGSSGSHRVGWQSVGRELLLLVAAFGLFVAAWQGEMAHWPSNADQSALLVGSACLAALAYMQLSTALDLNQLTAKNDLKPDRW